jgi:hypothetical protein
MATVTVLYSSMARKDHRTGLDWLETDIIIINHLIKVETNVAVGPAESNEIKNYRNQIGN